MTNRADRKLQTDRRTDRQTDGPTDKLTPIYPPISFGGYNNQRSMNDKKPQLSHINTFITNPLTT